MEHCLWHPNNFVTTITRKFLLMGLLLTDVPFYAQYCGDKKTTYAIDQCLQKQQNLNDDRLQQHINNQTFAEIKFIRTQLCNQIAKPYSNGTYSSIKYGFCVLSFNQWYQDQSRR